MVNHLIQKDVTTEVIGPLTPEFSDPTEQGWKKLVSTDWLQGTLLKANTDDLEVEDEMGEVDLDYERYDIVSIHTDKAVCIHTLLIYAVTTTLLVHKYSLISFSLSTTNLSLSCSVVTFPILCTKGRLFVL